MGKKGVQQYRVDLLLGKDEELPKLQLLQDTFIKRELQVQLQLAGHGRSASLEQGLKLVLAEPVGFDPRTIDDMTCAQSWECEDVQALLARCSRRVRLQLEAEAEWEYRHWCEAVYASLHAVLACCPATGLHLLESAQVMSTERFLQNPYTGSGLEFLHGGLNLRIFGVDSEEEVLIDTVGLQAAGLYDVQCHYRGLPQTQMVDYVFDVASYLFENGPIIEDGNTIDGLTPSDVWLCQFEEAQIPPNRLVLDIHTGKYAAGRRT